MEEERSQLAIGLELEVRNDRSDGVGLLAGQHGWWADVQGHDAGLDGLERLLAIEDLEDARLHELANGDPRSGDAADKLVDGKLDRVDTVGRFFVVGCFIVGCFIVGRFVGARFVVGCFVGARFVVGCFVGGRFVVGCFVAGCFVVGCFVAGRFVVGCFVAGCFVVGCFVAGRFVGARFVVGRFVVGRFVVGCFADPTIKRRFVECFIVDGCIADRFVAGCPIVGGFIVAGFIVGGFVVGGFVAGRFVAGCFVASRFVVSRSIECFVVGPSIAPLIDIAATRNDKVIDYDVGTVDDDARIGHVMGLVCIAGRFVGSARVVAGCFAIGGFVIEFSVVGTRVDYVVGFVIAAHNHVVGFVVTMRIDRIVGFVVTMRIDHVVGGVADGVRSGLGRASFDTRRRAK